MTMHVHFQERSMRAETKRSDEGIYDAFGTNITLSRANIKLRVKVKTGHYEVRCNDTLRECLCLSVVNTSLHCIWECLVILCKEESKFGIEHLKFIGANDDGMLIDRENLVRVSFAEHLER